MRLQVLLSVMNLDGWQDQIKLMNITSGVIVINQVTDKSSVLISDDRGDVVVKSFTERGLSKSRNRAIETSNADICLIADGDITYDNRYVAIIKKAFQDNSDVDVIVFRVDRVDGSPMRIRPGRIGLFYSMKVNSKQIAFRRKSIVGKGIRFNERFGAGTDLYMGEENIFLSECRRQKLKIKSVPIKIAHLRPHTSTWSRERNKNFFYIKGRMFYRISVPLAHFLGAQFALRKAGRRNDSIGLLPAVSAIFRGISDESRL